VPHIWDRTGGVEIVKLLTVFQARSWPVIERKYYQRQLGEGFIRDSIDDCWEPWMKIADEILDDEELIEPVYEALRRRGPKSATRGRKGTRAEVALRMLALKHMRKWSFEVVEREVRANLVYREFTRVGAEKVPDAKTLARIEAALGPEVFQKVQGRIVGIAKEKKRWKAAECDWTRRSRRPTFITPQLQAIAERHRASRRPGEADRR
jgi:hypothetical protein